jgi:hypothetical protein
VVCLKMWRRVVILTAMVFPVLQRPAMAWQNQTAEIPKKALEEMERIMREREARRAQETAQPAPTERPIARWTDAELEAIGRLLSGTWISKGEIDGAQVVMNIAPVGIRDLPNALYCEIARTDNLREPYRQTILTLGRVRGVPRLTTWEFRRKGGKLPSAYWAWAEPTVFPTIDPVSDLLGTIGVDLTREGDGWAGSSPHPYPTGTMGAVEMTTELRIANAGLQTADRGFAPDGSQMWGPNPGESYTFVRHDLGFKVYRHEAGPVAITMPTELRGKVAAEGDRCTTQYSGYLPDGTRFDSTFDRNMPFTYTIGQPLIDGWKMLATDFQEGMVRRIYVPAPLAYGATGRPRLIPPNTDLYFDIEVIKIETPPPPDAKPAETPPQPAPSEAQPK